jgi:hypothetical protein
MNKNKWLGICILAAVTETKKEEKIDRVFLLTILATICIAIGFVFAFLELIGFFKEEGTVGMFVSLLGGLLFAVWMIGESGKSTAAILESIDAKTTLLCQENVKTREEIVKALSGDGDKTRETLGKILVEIRDILKGGR